jgi:hypothetical protein
MKFSSARLNGLEKEKREERGEEKRVSTLERSGFIAHAIARVKEDHEVLVGQTKWFREGQERGERRRGLVH